jgi:hypothetical protein
MRSEWIRNSRPSTRLVVLLTALAVVALVMLMRLLLG